jgi:hypothetical protein
LLAEAIRLPVALKVASLTLARGMHAHVSDLSLE